MRMLSWDMDPYLVVYDEGHQNHRKGNLKIVTSVGRLTENARN